MTSVAGDRAQHSSRGFVSARREFISPNVERQTAGCLELVMTAVIYLGEMLVASLLAILLLAISHFGMSGDAAPFVGGVVGWTLAEYLVHRFVLHGLAPTQHGHAPCQPRRGCPHNLWQIWVCFALLYLIAGPHGLPLPLLKHHQIHHRFATRNYGVSTTFWDRVFGTMLHS